MKSLALLALFVVGTPAHAQTAAHSLFDYTVYAKDSIFAECSDYQGRTAAGGTVSLRDFAIVLPADQTGCPLESNSSVNTINGAILTGQNASCVATPHFTFRDTNVSFQASSLAPYASLSQQMDTLSAKLAAPMANTSVKQITLDMNQVRATHNVSLSGSANTLLVVNVLDQEVSIYNYGIFLNGGLTPQNIVWNFPNATKLFIAYSGMANYGLPGTFVAPNAQVTFNNARITGALFAKSILGKADSLDCKGVVSGQVNGSCLSDIVPGIGCSSGCDQTGGQQQQHQHP
jgi:choice-of-anchor A domain-containing protein